VSDPTGPAPIRSVPWLPRLKETEPVRLYAYTVLSALTLVAVLAGWLSGEWPEALMGVAGAVLGVIPAAEAARASVYSPRSHNAQLVQTVLRARGSWTVEAASDPDLSGFRR
jgi:hypothetical protein